MLSQGGLFSSPRNSARRFESGRSCHQLNCCEAQQPRTDTALIIASSLNNLNPSRKFFSTFLVCLCIPSCQRDASLNYPKCRHSTACSLGKPLHGLRDATECTRADPAVGTFIASGVRAHVKLSMCLSRAYHTRIAQSNRPRGSLSRYLPRD